MKIAIKGGFKDDYRESMCLEKTNGMSKARD